MANDMDMLREIDEYREEGNEQIADDLELCYSYRYGGFSGTQASLNKAERLKKAFRKKHGFWGNYY